MPDQHDDAIRTPNDHTAADERCDAPASDDDGNSTRARVREGYARIAVAGGWSEATAESRGLDLVSASDDGGCCGGGGCCGPATFTPDALAAAIGYDADEVAVVPEGANLGLSCGNPTALASLVEGEVVLDLGSGGGFDCFVAGAKVGASGRVIGVDMTPEMLGKARANVASYRDRTGLANVEFRLGEIEHLPVADGSVDVVISNCVLNLSPDKPQVWRAVASRSPTSRCCSRCPVRCARISRRSSAASPVRCSSRRSVATRRPPGSSRSNWSRSRSTSRR